MDSTEILLAASLGALCLKLWSGGTQVVNNEKNDEENEKPIGAERLIPYRVTPSLLQPCVCSVVPRVIVFDLDYTLISEPIESLKVQDVSKGHRAKSFYDAEFLRSFLELCSSRGHHVRIATMAEPRSNHEESADDVILLLDSVLPRQRRYLNDRAHIACWRSNLGKNTHIEQILRSTKESDEGDFDAGQVLLLDDCLANIRLAESDCYEAFYVPNPTTVTTVRNTSMTSSTGTSSTGTTGVASPNLSASPNLLTSPNLKSAGTQLPGICIDAPPGVRQHQQKSSSQQSSLQHGHGGAERRHAPNDNLELNSMTFPSSPKPAGGGGAPPPPPRTGTIGLTRAWFAREERLQFLLGIFDGDVANCMRLLQEV